MKLRTSPRRRQAVVCTGLLIAAFIAAWEVAREQPAPITPEQALPPTAVLGRPWTPIDSTVRLQAPQGTREPRPDELTASDWAIPYGREFWRGATSPRTADSPEHPKPATSNTSALNTSDIVERVSHALKQAPDGATHQVVARTYTARFDEAGLRFSPHRLPHEANAHARPPEGDTQTRTSGTLTPILAQPDPEAEALFRTVSIRCGQETILRDPAQARRWLAVGNTAQALLQEPLAWVEHYETRQDGVAVTWVLGSRPPGADAVCVEAELTGLHYGGQTAHGHHFADRTGTLCVRLGQASLVDAGGRTWPLAVQAEGTRLRIEVSAGTLTEATFPVAIDPVVGPEFGLDEAVSLPLLGESLCGVASNGRDYLVVWTRWPVVQSYPVSWFRLYGTRVSGTGVVLDPEGILIDDSTPYYYSVVVGSDGDRFLVAWLQPWDVYGPVTRPPGIYGMFVTATGGLEGRPAATTPPPSPPTPGPIPINTNQAFGFEMALAGGTNGYLLAWRADNSVSGLDTIYAARISRVGQVLTPSVLQLSLGPIDAGEPAVAARGADFFVAWHGYQYLPRTDYEIYGTVVTGSGIMVDPGGVRLTTDPGNQEYPAVAASASGYLLAWQDWCNPGPNDPAIYAARLGPDGAVLDANGFPVCETPGMHYNPEVISDGTDYLVVWEESLSEFPYDIWGARVTDDGQVLDPGGLAINTGVSTQERPAVASNGTNFFVVWQNQIGYANPAAEVYGSLVSLAGAVASAKGQKITPGTEVVPHYAPAVAGNGANFLVVWHDLKQDVWGTRVSPEGQALDPGGLAISTGDQAELDPVVASNGGDYLVAWRDHRTGQFDLYASRVTTSGLVVDLNGLPVAARPTNQRAPALAGRGADYLLVWEESPTGGTTNLDIYATRIGPDATALDPAGLAISTATSAQHAPAVAGNGDNWLVVWQDNRNGTNELIYGARVSAGGIVLEPDGFAIGPSAWPQRQPAVDSDGTDYLVVWSDYRNATCAECWANWDIFGARVRSDGVVLDPAGFALSRGPNEQATPVVTFHGSQYLVAWEDVFVDSVEDTDYFNLYGAVVSPDGVLGQSLYFSSGHRDHCFPAAGSSGGRSLVVYQSSPGGGANSVPRIHANRVSLSTTVDLYLSSGTSIVEEGGPLSQITFTVQRSGPDTGPFLVELATTDDTATAGQDYVAQSTVLSFAADEMSKGVTVPLLDDGLVEEMEYFQVSLRNPTSPVDLGLYSTVTVAIRDNECPANRVDAAFDPGVGVESSPAVLPAVYALAVQTNGDLLIGGSFGGYHGTPRTGLARVRPDGSLDSSFRPGLEASARINAIQVQPDGRILIGGQFSTVQGAARQNLARLNADASLDETFIPPQPVGYWVAAIALQPDGAVLVGGWNDVINGIPRSFVVRLDSAGLPDPMFHFTSSDNTTLTALALQADGRILAGGRFEAGANIIRVNANGTRDTGFVPAPELGLDPVATIAVQPDGRILVGGIPDYSYTRPAVARLEANGALDPTFHVQMPSRAYSSTVQSLCLQPDGGVMIGGNFGEIEGLARRGIARLDSNGSLDRTWDPGTGVEGEYGIVYAVAPAAAGGVWIGGGFTHVNGVPRSCVARLLGGDLANTIEFTSPTDPGEPAFVLTEPGIGFITVKRCGDSRGEVAVALEFADGTATNGIDFLATNSTVTFAPLEVVKQMPVTVPDDEVVELDKIFQVRVSDPTSGARLGSQSSATAVIYDDDHAPSNVDPTWAQTSISGGDDGEVFALARQADGKVIVAGDFTQAGSFTRRYIARFNADGTLDPGFDPGASISQDDEEWISAVAVQVDGQVLIGGGFTSVAGHGRSGLARLQANGSLDTNFNAAIQGQSVRVIVLQPDGKILVGGILAATPNIGLVRLHEAGTQDTNFVVTVQGSSGISAIALDSTARVLIGGEFALVNGAARYCVARLQTNGSLDAGFVPQVLGPWQTQVRGIQVQPDGRILIAGVFDSVNGVPRHSIARLNDDGSLDQTFDAGSGPNDWVNALLLQPDGRLVLGGWFDRVNGVRSSGIARLNPDGSYDMAFAPLGLASVCHALLGQPDGRILAGGLFGSGCAGSDPDDCEANFGVLRLNPDPPLLLNAPHPPPPAGITLTFRALPGRTYWLQASTNLTDWISIQNRFADRTSLTFTDPEGANLPHRFYRLWEQP